MPFGLSASGSPDQQNTLSFGGNLSQLIEGETLSLGSSDPSRGASGESQGANSESFGYIEESDIISDGSDNGDNSFLIAALGEDSGDPGD